MKRPIQYFSDEYLASSAGMSATQICKFLDDFRFLAVGRHKEQPRTPISVRVPGPLLESFKAKAKLEGVPYQTKIQELMAAWVTGEGGGERSE